MTDTRDSVVYQANNLMANGTIFQSKWSQISNIELGRHQPPLHVLYDIASVLNFDLQLLLPTFSEVEKQISSNEYSDILKNISDLDDESKKSIEEIIKNLNK